MQLFISVITLSLMITPLVVLHELGHYLTAKYYGVRVLEFGIGFPPKFLSIWTTYKELKLQTNTDIEKLKKKEI